MRNTMMVPWALGLFFAATSGCAQTSATDTAEDVGSATEAVVLSKKTVTLSTGIQMAYQEMGDPHGDPVIFLHGYTDTGRSFYPTIQALLARTSVGPFLSSAIVLAVAGGTFLVAAELTKTLSVRSLLRRRR